MSVTEENSLEEIKSLVYLQDKVSMHVACRAVLVFYSTSSCKPAIDLGTSTAYILKYPLNLVPSSNKTSPVKPCMIGPLLWLLCLWCGKIKSSVLMEFAVQCAEISKKVLYFLSVSL